MWMSLDKLQTHHIFVVCVSCKVDECGSGVDNASIVREERYAIVGHLGRNLIQRDDQTLCCPITVWLMPQ